MVFKKKAQGLPINILVMLIIAIVIFSLGLGLFSKFNNESDKQIEELENKIQTGLSNIECDTAEQICSSTNKIKNGEQKTFLLYLVNIFDEKKNYKVEFLDSNGNFLKVLNPSCGEIEINYLSLVNVKIASQSSAKFPFIVKANKVKKTPCSFIATANLIDVTSNQEVSKTAVIVRVE